MFLLRPRSLLRTVARRVGRPLFVVIALTAKAAAQRGVVFVACLRADVPAARPRGRSVMRVVAVRLAPGTSTSVPMRPASQLSLTVPGAL